MNKLHQAISKVVTVLIPLALTHSRSEFKKKLITGYKRNGKDVPAISETEAQERVDRVTCINVVRSGFNSAIKAYFKRQFNIEITTANIIEATTQMTAAKQIYSCPTKGSVLLSLQPITSNSTARVEQLLTELTDINLNLSL